MPWLKDSIWTLCGSIGLALTIFFVDLSVPLGVAGGVPYIMVVLMALWLPWKGAPFWVAGCCTVLTIAGFFLSPPGGEQWQVLANRGLAIGAVMVTAILAYHYKKRAEAVREYENQYRLVADNVPALIAYIDSDYRFKFVNQPYLNRQNLSLRDVLGQHVRSVIGEESFRQVEPNMKAALDGHTTSFEMKTQFPSGTLRWVSATYVPNINEEKLVEGFFALLIDIEEQKETEQRLQEAYYHLREVSRRLENVEEAERQRIARELHDEFGQTLTVLKFDLAGLGRMIKGGLPCQKRPELMEKIGAMSTLVNQTVQIIRRIASSLRPTLLDDLGLVPALEWQARDFQKRTGIHCEFSCNHEFQEMTIAREVSSTLFRLTQELLTNVLRHAKATHVFIHCTIEKNRLVLKVTDDGVGILDSQINQPLSFGLMGMRERTSLVGGEFAIHGTPGRGTVAVARIPNDLEGLEE